MFHHKPTILGIPHLWKPPDGHVQLLRVPGPGFGASLADGFGDPPLVLSEVRAMWVHDLNTALYIWGFPARHGGTPIAGWFMLGKIPLKWMITRGSPMTQETNTYWLIDCQDFRVLYIMQMCKKWLPIADSKHQSAWLCSARDDWRLGIPSGFRCLTSMVIKTYHSQVYVRHFPMEKWLRKWLNDFPPMTRLKTRWFTYFGDVPVREVSNCQRIINKSGNQVDP